VLHGEPLRGSWDVRNSTATRHGGRFGPIPRQRGCRAERMHGREAPAHCRAWVNATAPQGGSFCFTIPIAGKLMSGGSGFGMKVPQPESLTSLREPRLLSRGAAVHRKAPGSATLVRDPGSGTRGLAIGDGVGSGLGLAEK